MDASLALYMGYARQEPSNQRPCAFSRHATPATLQVYYDRDAGIAAEVANMITAGM